MVTKGDTVGLVEKLLNRAEHLINNYISKEYKSEHLVAFLAWMKLSDKSTEIQACLAAIAKEHK
ncbi:115_t:CDS:2, partial [Dentiscutata erythropus]